MSLNSKQYGSLFLRKEFQSDIVALTAGAGSVEIPLDPDYRHWYFGVEFYTDANGTPGEPTGGTYTFTVKTAAMRDNEQGLSGGAVDIAVDGLVERNSSGNVQTLKTVLASITGGSVTHFRVRAIGNIS